MPTRDASSVDPTLRIRLVHTPKHIFWLNQMEIWLGILGRRLLKRASFTSVEALCERIFALFNSFNQAMAKPAKWTYVGCPLVAYPSAA